MNYGRSHYWPRKKRFSKTKFREKIRLAYDMRHNPTAAEEKAWGLIKKHARHVFFRQSVIGGYIVDFWAPQIATIIEIDGSSHEGREKSDLRRDTNLRQGGLTTVRFPNEVILNKPKEFIDFLEHL
jgi:very-short-patch-repair endonuclease